MCLTKRNIKNNQIRMKNTISEMKNILEGVNSRLNDTEDGISKMEDSVEEMTDIEQIKEKEKMKTVKESSEIKCTNMCIIGVSEGKEKEAENIFEYIIAED